MKDSMKKKKSSFMIYLDKIRIIQAIKNKKSKQQKKELTQFQI